MNLTFCIFESGQYWCDKHWFRPFFNISEWDGSMWYHSFFFQRKFDRNTRNLEKTIHLKCWTINLTFCIFESGKFRCDKHWFRPILKYFRVGLFYVITLFFRENLTVTHGILNNNPFKVLNNKFDLLYI